MVRGFREMHDILGVREGPRSRPFAHWRLSQEPVLELGPRSRAQAIDDAPRWRGAKGDLDQETTRFHDRAGPSVVAWVSGSHASPVLGSEVAPMAKPARSRRSRTPRLPRQTNPTPPVVHPNAA